MDDFEEIKVSDGESIFDIKALAAHLYFLESGVVDLVNAEGKVFASVQAGQSFGEAAILEGGVRSAGARAHGPVVCKRISALHASQLLLSQSPLLVVVLESLLLQQSMQNTLRNASLAVPP